jgi:hypothetical protein
MATERIQLSLSGFIAIGRVSSEQSAPYARTLKRVSLSTRGDNPAGVDISIQIQFDGAPLVGQYLLPAGLKFAENTPNLLVPANTIISFIVTAAPAPGPSAAADLDVTLDLFSGPDGGGLDTTDCGLGTLGELKRFCITASMSGQGTFDTTLTLIGRGIAKLFNDALGRRLKREVGVMEQFSFARTNLVSIHAPLETVTKMELKYTEAEGWVDLTSGLPNCLIDYDEGIVRVPADFWPISAQFRYNTPGIWRLTVDGGYWYDPTDDGTGTLPTGAFELPPDLKLAWLLQSQHLFINGDSLGISWSPAGEVHDTRKSLANVKFIPLVQTTLSEYHRAVNLR